MRSTTLLSPSDGPVRCLVENAEGVDAGSGRPGQPAESSDGWWAPVLDHPVEQRAGHRSLPMPVA